MFLHWSPLPLEATCPASAWQNIMYLATSACCFLPRSTMQLGLLSIGYIGDLGQLASAWWLKVTKWSPSLWLSAWNDTVQVPVSLLFSCSYRGCCSMCSHVEIFVSLFGLNESGDVAQVESWELAVESNSETHAIYSSGQLETGLDWPGFTLLVLEAAELHLAELCCSMRPSYLQLQHRWAIVAFQEFHGTVMGCKEIWAHPETATSW